MRYGGIFRQIVKNTAGKLIIKRYNPALFWRFLALMQLALSCVPKLPVLASAR
jgi:hypothetical protein